jgi:hypothetical protein
MHRSGTSIFARGLRVLGAELGERLMPPDPYNPRGFWEDLDVVGINQRVLAALARDWRSPTLIDAAGWDSAVLAPMASEAEQLLKSRLEQYRTWGFKDPRLCLLLPFWQPVFQRLGLRESYVIALRNPRAVADSLATRDQIFPELSHLLWLQHLDAALLNTAGKPRVVVDYDEMLCKPRAQLCRIAKELEFAPPAADDPVLHSYETGFLDPKLRHHQHSCEVSASDSHLTKLALAVFGSLRAVALEQPGRGDSDLRAVADGVKAELEAFAKILPLAHQLDLRIQARETELGAAQAQVRALAHEVAKLRTELVPARHLAFEETHHLWNSSSWQLLRPMRDLIRGRRGEDKEAEPTPASVPDALRTIITVRQSLSWELTSPVRVVHRLLSRGWASRSSRSGMQHRIADRARKSVELKSPLVLGSSAWKELLARGALIPWRNAPPGESNRPRIVFASHEATRTGAPLILLSLVRHFAQSRNYELLVFCDRPGSLLEAFVEIAHVIDGSRHDLFAISPTIDDLLGAFGNNRPILAICNTSVINHYAIAFKRLGLPVITLVHEMADRHSETQWREIYAASGRVIFPAEFVRATAHRRALLPTRKALVISQGLLDENFAAGDRAEARRSVVQELNLSEDAFLVLGCGTADLRKGIDLFVELAQKVGALGNDAPVHFVWLGANGGDLALWLENEIAARGLDQRVHLVGERDAPAPFFMAANAFVLTSRADPFPCVVHEAMVSETPVIAFEGVGGAPEALDGGCGIVVPFGDIAAMAEAVIALYRDPEAAMRMAKLAKERVLTKYCFEDYFHAITRLARNELGVLLPEGGDVKPVNLAAAKLDCEKNDFLLIRKDADFDVDFYLPPSSPRLSRDQAIDQFMRESATTGAGRKPYSGFNPQIYAEQEMQPRDLETRNPLAHFIEQAKPSGPWMIPLIRASKSSPGATRLSSAMHVHAYYPELMEELLACLAANLSRCDLFVTTGRNEDLEQLKKLLASYDRGEVHFSVVPNRGRDIGPFLTQYGWLNTKYHLVGHLHCKKTAHLSAEVGQTWRHFLWWNLVGNGYPMMDVIAKQFEDDKRLGLVFPDDPHIVGWWSNKECAEALAKKMRLTTALPQAFEFPVGTMFWCRPAALRPLFDLGLSWDDYPPEPVPIDGTILHALERIIPFVVQHEGYRFAATHIPGVER